MATLRFPDEVPQERPEPTATPPIVAIGASAGGVEALRAFFEQMPGDSGLAFAVVTHQEPDRDSMLREILARVTSMEVLDAEHGRTLRPNQVHVAPRKMGRSASDGAPFSDTIVRLPRGYRSIPSFAAWRTTKRKGRSASS